MKSIELEVGARDVLGKKVRFMRRQGKTPAHIFGHNVESRALQCDTAKLQKVLLQAGHTRLVDLKLDNDGNTVKVLMREVQRDPVTRALLHVDFYQVSMEEKIKMEIPIAMVGKAPALDNKDLRLYHELNTLDIEVLPDRIPQTIDVDISVLTELDQAIRVKDLKLGEGITIFNNPEVLIVRIGEKPKEEVFKPVVTEAEAAAAEGAPAAEGVAAPAAEAGKEEAKGKGKEEKTA